MVRPEGAGAVGVVGMAEVSGVARNLERGARSLGPNSRPRSGRRTAEVAKRRRSSERWVREGVAPSRSGVLPQRTLINFIFTIVRFGAF